MKTQYFNFEILMVRILNPFPFCWCTCLLKLSRVIAVLRKIFYIHDYSDGVTSPAFIGFSLPNHLNYHHIFYKIILSQSFLSFLNYTFPHICKQLGREWKNLRSQIRQPAQSSELTYRNTLETLMLKCLNIYNLSCAVVLLFISTNTYEKFYFTPCMFVVFDRPTHRTIALTFPKLRMGNPTFSPFQNSGAIFLWATYFTYPTGT